MGKRNLTLEERLKMIASTDRLIIAVISLVAIFAIIILDGMGIITIEKWGFGAIGAWVTIILQFFFRKAGSGAK